MSWLTFDVVVTVLGTALGCVALVPQLIRLRQGDVAGVSFATAAVWAANGWAWTAYGAGAKVWPLVFASAGPALTGTFVAFAVGRRSPIRSGLVLTAGWCSLLIMVLALRGWGGLGAVLGVSVFVSYTPQVIAAWRAETLSGLSPLTWVLALGEGIVWVVFGVVRRDLPTGMWGAAATGAALAILAGWWRWRRRVELDATALSHATMVL